MIPKGNLHANGGKLATYITKGEDDEKAELIEMRGFAATDLQEAFSDIQDIADSQTQCQKPFFHAYVRLPKDESLTREQWLETANRIEAKLGFDGQPRGVALHFLEDGTAHMHVAWSRIDTDQMKAIDPGLYLRKMKEVCRELEVEFGLHQVSSELPPDRQTAAPKRPEFEQDRRLGIDGTEAREAIRSCYDRCDNGPSFAAALAEFDITLARGDRYAFVAVDSEGGLHALGKRTLGVTLAEIEGKLGADFAKSLPTVDAVREGIEARQEAASAAPEVEAKEAHPAHQTQDEIKRCVTDLWNASDSGEAFVAGLEGLGLTLAKGDRRGFVLIDPQGEIHALPRMIEGARTADVREKLRDIDPASLPTVAEAKALTELAAAAREQTERRAEAFDRDAADRSWQAKVNEAGISSGGISPTQGAAPETRPLSQAAGEIRFAWGLSQSGAGFAAALEDRGILLAEVSRDEAESSQRLAAFAKQVGHFAPTYSEGELVAVNGFGGVYRLSAQTIGESRNEIADYLKSVDRSTLLNVSETRDVMREAARNSYAEEMEKARPATPIETLIYNHAKTSANGEGFVAGLGAEGITLARATASDLGYLESEVAIGFARDQPLPQSLLKITEGELVAVNRFGGIHRLNPHRIDSDLCAALVEDCGRELPGDSGVPSIQAARSEALDERASQANYWQMIRDYAQAGRDERAGAPNTATADEIENSKAEKGEPHPTDGAAMAGAAIVGALAEGAAKIADAIGDLIFPSAPLTREQKEENRAAAERAEAAAAPAREARREMTEEEARLAAIAKAQAAMEEALNESKADRDRKDRDDEYGHERTR